MRNWLISKAQFLNKGIHYNLVHLFTDSVEKLFSQVYLDYVLIHIRKFQFFTV